MVAKNSPVLEKDAAASIRPTEIQQVARWPSSRNRRRSLMYLVTLAVPLLVLGVSVLGFDLPVIAGLVASALAYAGLFLLLNWRPRLEEELESLRESIETSLGRSRRLALQLKELEPHLTPLLSDTARVRLQTICGLAQDAASDLASAGGTTLQTASNLEHLLSETVDALGLYRQVARRGAFHADRSEKISSAIENDLLVVVESALTDLSASFGDKESLRLEVAVQVLKNTVAVEGATRIK